MLIPRRVKYRKQHHPKRSGKSKGGTAVAFGDFGLQATEGGYVTNRQIEAARIAMTRFSGVTLETANAALSRAAHKLPVKSRVVLREEA